MCIQHLPRGDVLVAGMRYKCDTLPLSLLYTLACSLLVVAIKVSCLMYSAQRLLFSHNGTHPHLFKQRSMSKNGQLLVQNVQLVLGLLYHVSLTSNHGGDHLCEECRLLHHDFTLTRDRNREFHIFQHTTRHSEVISANSHASGVYLENCTCSLLSHEKSGASYSTLTHQDTLLWSGESHHTHGDHVGVYSPLQMSKDGHCVVTRDEGEGCLSQTAKSNRLYRPLRVATYNIWNVNSLSGVKESYEDRITRLGKVNSIVSMLISLSVHAFLVKVVNHRNIF